MALFDDLLEAQKLFFETSERIGTEAAGTLKTTLEALAKAVEGGGDRARVAELERELARVTEELRRARQRPPETRAPPPPPPPAQEKKSAEETKSDRFELIEID